MSHGRGGVLCTPAGGVPQPARFSPCCQRLAVTRSPDWNGFYLRPFRAQTREAPTPPKPAVRLFGAQAAVSFARPIIRSSILSAQAAIFASMDFLRVFRVLALAEAVSWLLLIFATMVKYGVGQAVGVQVLGPLHGALFIAYVLLALLLWRKNEWTGRTLAIVLVDSVLPGGGLWVARRADLNAAEGPQIQPSESELALSAQRDMPS